MTHEPEWQPRTDTARLLALSDGIFAVAMTLAAAQILPSDLGKRLYHEGSSAVLADLKPQFTGIALTFMLVGLYWMTHHRIFSYVRRTSQRFTTLNLFFLLGITLMPSAVQFSSLPPSDVTAVVVYGAYVGGLGLLLALIWESAVRGRLTDPHLDPRVVRYNRYRSLITAGVFLLSCPVAVAFGANAGRLTWLAVFFNGRIAKKLA